MDTNEQISLLHALRDLILQEQLHTQEQFCTKLQAMGYEVNQSKISRLLRKLGAMKTQDFSGQVRYILPKEPEPVSDPSVHERLIRSITHNETLVVLHTVPGAASLVARLVDYNLEQIMAIGTIAGDDVVAIIPSSVKQIEKTINALEDLLFSPKDK